jgi:hypothetical protein
MNGSATYFWLRILQSFTSLFDSLELQLFRSSFFIQVGAVNCGVGFREGFPKLRELGGRRIGEECEAPKLKSARITSFREPRR